VRATVVFDLDDTLVRTQPLYDEAKQRFVQLMAAQGFQDGLVEKLDEIDEENVELYGFSKHRFPQSIRETYAFYCREAGRPIDPLVSESASRIGYSVFERTPELMPYAEEVLDQLREAGCLLVLYTLGDPEVQEDRLVKLDLARRFDLVHIVARANNEAVVKDAAMLKHFLRQHNLSPYQTWMVGNSPRSDILPAIYAGMRAIYLHSETWRYDNVELLPGEVYDIHDLREIMPVLAGAVQSNTRHGERRASSS
jgi:putative hydrolase of the HAD superfamily